MSNTTKLVLWPLGPTDAARTGVVEFPLSTYPRPSKAYHGTQSHNK